MRPIYDNNYFSRLVFVYSKDTFLLLVGHKRERLERLLEEEPAPLNVRQGKRLLEYGRHTGQTPEELYREAKEARDTRLRADIEQLKTLEVHAGALMVIELTFDDVHFLREDMYVAIPLVGGI